MDVYYTNTAKRQLKKLEHHIQERIVDKMRFFVAQPEPLQFAEPLGECDVELQQKIPLEIGLLWPSSHSLSNFSTFSLPF